MLKYKITKNKLFLFFAVFFMICVLSVASGMLIVSAREKISGIRFRQTDLTQPISKNSSISEAGQPVYFNSADIPTVLYIVAEHNGAVGIYDSTRTELIELLDVDVNSLPDIDRAYLINGIKIYSPSQLLSVICDYTG
jgi:hypothetical protein